MYEISPTNVSNMHVSNPTFLNMMKRLLYITNIPVVPQKAVAEVSKIGNL